MADPQFDVFLCHNSEDKPAVIEIAQQLQQNGIKPWLDVWELKPGDIWQYALEQQIESIKGVAIFVGRQGIGPWQKQEIYAFLQEFIEREHLVIPVLLPDAPQKPKLPIFLKNRHWVDFRLHDPVPLVQLIWGITGQKPQKPSSTEKGSRIAESVSVQDVATAQTSPPKSIAPKPTQVALNKSKQSQPPQQRPQSGPIYSRSYSTDSRRSNTKHTKRQVNWREIPWIQLSSYFTLYGIQGYISSGAKAGAGALALAGAGALALAGALAGALARTLGTGTWAWLLGWARVGVGAWILALALALVLVVAVAVAVVLTLTLAWAWVGTLAGTLAWVLVWVGAKKSLYESFQPMYVFWILLGTAITGLCIGALLGSLMQAR